MCVFVCAFVIYLNHSCYPLGSSCGRADSVIDSHTTCPGFKTRMVRYIVPNFRLTTTISVSVQFSSLCVEGQGRISRSGLTQDIKMGSCVLPFHINALWIAQQQVGPVSVYCVCGMAFLCGSTLVKVLLLQAGTVAI